VAAPGPGSDQAGGGAFADEVAFELGQAAKTCKTSLPPRGGGVDRFLEAPEPERRGRLGW
jgi:hypothetical protein